MVDSYTVTYERMSGTSSGLFSLGFSTHVLFKYALTIVCAAYVCRFNRDRCIQVRPTVKTGHGI